MDLEISVVAIDASITEEELKRPCRQSPDEKWCCLSSEKDAQRGCRLSIVVRFLFGEAQKAQSQVVLCYNRRDVCVTMLRVQNPRKMAMLLIRESCQTCRRFARVVSYLLAGP